MVGRMNPEVFKELATQSAAALKKALKAIIKAFSAEIWTTAP